MLANQLKIKECCRTCKGPKSTVSECKMNLHNNAFDGHQSKCKLYIYTLKKAGLFQTKFGQNIGKPKCWFKNAITKFTVESES